MTTATRTTHRQCAREKCDYTGDLSAIGLCPDHQAAVKPPTLNRRLTKVRRITDVENAYGLEPTPTKRRPRDPKLPPTSILHRRDLTITYPEYRQATDILSTLTPRQITDLILDQRLPRKTRGGIELAPYIAQVCQAVHLNRYQLTEDQ